MKRRLNAIAFTLALAGLLTAGAYWLAGVARNGTARSARQSKCRAGKPP